MEEVGRGDEGEVAEGVPSWRRLNRDLFCVFWKVAFEKFDTIADSLGEEVSPDSFLARTNREDGAVPYGEEGTAGVQRRDASDVEREPPRLSALSEGKGEPLRREERVNLEGGVVDAQIGGLEEVRMLPLPLLFRERGGQRDLSLLGDRVFTADPVDEGR